MISALEMFTIGIGPSSSHTVGPMRAARRFVTHLKNQQQLSATTAIKIELFGSLGQTGKGHGTGKAVILGLLGETPETVDVDSIPQRLAEIDATEQLALNGEHPVPFPRTGAIIFHRRKTLAAHSNGMTCHAWNGETLLAERTYYSVGGGFITEGAGLNHPPEPHNAALPYPFTTAQELLSLGAEHGLSVSELMLANERAMRPEQQTRDHINNVWRVMKESVANGCRATGLLPGGLRVARRAPGLYRRLQAEARSTVDPLNAMDWVNLFALAVNEENAGGGRVVTAPTNGAAGIIPAVLCYYDKFVQNVDENIVTDYFLTATAIGALYKHNASISGAEVGCQGEVGVACSMAAGALAAILGGTNSTIENAAEIGMEHNLGLTCDPVGGLVQVPCIERNAMGAIKAINAARLAMRGTGLHKVSLDKVIKTMRDTGRDMKVKYKETARGGLAVNIIEC